MSKKLRRRCKCGCGMKTNPGMKFILNHHKFTHRMTKTREYRTWICMIQRCHGHNGIGCSVWKKISVCKRWRNSFQDFLKDMGPRPNGTTIDRIDNNGDYTPENCRWASMKEQHRNKSTNHWIVFNGKRMILDDWDKTLGMGKGTFKTRLRRGWPLERALTPVNFKCKGEEKKRNAYPERIL